MQINDIIVPSSGNFNIFLLGDIHVGNRLITHEGIENTFQYIIDGHDGLKGHKKNIVIHHGDQVEGIFIDDPRYAANIHNAKSILRGYTDGPDEHPNLFSQISDSVQMLEPIAKYIRVMNTGNHNAKLLKLANMEYEICRSLGIQFATYSSVSRYVDKRGRVFFKHFHSHGFGSITSRVKPYKRAKLNMEISLRGALEQKMGDCLLMSMGHTHQLLVYKPSPELYMVGDESKIYQKWLDSNEFLGSCFIPGDYRWYVNSGSFIKLYGNGISGYSENAGYNPIPLGFVVAEVRGGRILDCKRFSAGSDGIHLLGE